MLDDLCGPASTLLPQNSQIPYTTPHVYASQPSIHKENVCLKKKKKHKLLQIQQTLGLDKQHLQHKENGIYVTDMHFNFKW